MSLLSIAYILALLAKYKYWLLFPVLVLEGPVATVLASFLASPAGGGLLDVVPVLIVVIVADITGDTMYYLIGFHTKDFFVKRYPKRFSIEPLRFARIEKYFERHGSKTIAIGKVSHGLGWPIMVAAGSAKMPYRRFIFINTIVSIPKSFILVGLGYYYGRDYETVVQYLGKAGTLFTTFAILALVYILYIKYSKKIAKFD